MAKSFVFPPDDSGTAERFATISLTTAWLTMRLIDSASEALDPENDEARLYLERATEVLMMDSTACVGGVAEPQLALWQRRRVQDLVTRRLADGLSLEDLAAASRLSRTHFARAFRASFDQAPHAYLMSRRIAAAQMAMMSGDKCLDEIALECGFEDRAEFSRCFRKVVGRSPHVWRRLARVSGACDRRDCDAGPE